MYNLNPICQGPINFMERYVTPVWTVEEMHCECPSVMQTTSAQALHNASAHPCSFSQQTAIYTYSTKTQRLGFCHGESTLA